VTHTSGEHHCGHCRNKHLFHEVEIGWLMADKIKPNQLDDQRFTKP
jgi:hypothetical protein